MKLTVEQLEYMLEHAYEDERHECCGLLWGRAGVVQHVQRATNVAHFKAAIYELDSQSLFRANELDSQGYEVAVYHTHPHNPAIPSSIDVAHATYPHWRYVIVSLVADPAVRVWRILGQDFEHDVHEEELKVV